MKPRTSARGVSLLELLVVLTILVALAAMALPRYDGLTQDARQKSTEQSLRQLQELIVNRYVMDMSDLVASTHAAVAKGLPGPHNLNLQPSGRQQWPQLAFLFVNPLKNDINSTYNSLTSRGWRGPYLLSNRGVYPGANPTDAVTRGFTDQYGQTGDPAVLDAWGNPIVIQLDPNFTQTVDSPIPYYRLVSAGPDNQLNTADDVTLPLR